ncbi:MAG: YqgE/AlgH family protein [Muribaculaceae bacterium]|nr:YqgE/AlgH family protein [Muribaculaceae bacterium]
MRDITTDIFNVPTVKGDVRQGAILVAEPFLAESYFNHGVLSLVDYNAGEGAMGVVMNYRTANMLSDVLDGISPQFDAPVYCGGPLGQDRLFFIHTLGSDIIGNAREYAPGLYVGGDFDAITDYVNSGYQLDGVLRFFVGYSGWSRGQLEEELANDVWALSDFTDPHELLHGSGDSYWHRCVRHMGEPYRAWQLLPRNIQAN